MNPEQHAALCAQLERTEAVMVELLRAVGAPADAVTTTGSIFALIAKLAAERRTVH